MTGKERTVRQRRTVAERMRPVERVEVPVPVRQEDHGDLWRAISEIRDKVNWTLGALALLIPLTIATFVAVVLR